MKAILLSIVLGVTAVAIAQTSTTAPAQGQSAAPAQAAASSQGPVIKDPAEYNAYIAAVGQKDANAKISGLEAFLMQYPASVMKNQALEILMQAYQQANNPKKMLDTGARLVASDPCNMRGLALLAHFNRVLAQNADPNGNLADAKKYGQQGLDCLPKATDPDIVKMKDQMTAIFRAAIGIACLQDKDYKCATESLKVAADANPTDFSVVYPLALAFWPDVKTTASPDNTLNAIWYASRASALAPAQVQAQIEKYARSLYIRYHGGDDGWPDVLGKAKAGTAAPADLATLIKPAPTPAEQAHKMIQDTTESDGKQHPEKMDFAQWEFVLTNASADDQSTVWTAIKGKPFPFVGTVINTTPTVFMIAGSSDDIDAKKADITLQFEDKLPKTLIPKDGSDNFQFSGEPASYTSSPFMMVFEKGRLVNTKPSAAAAHKPSAAHKGTTQ
jgi:tetratricopeptide (TPR) repeat protein